MAKHRSSSPRAAGAEALRQQQIAAAVAHLNAGRLADAERIARLVLFTRPDDADALNIVGVVAGRRGAHAEAAEHLSRAVDRDRRNPFIQFNFANALRRIGEARRAVEHFERAERLKPGFAEALMAKGDALRDLLDWDAAARAYTAALRANGALAGARNGLALCALAHGDAPGAIAHYSAALDAVPVSDMPARAAVLANLGAALIEAGSGLDGLRALTEAATLVPANDDIAHRLAASLRHARVIPAGEPFRRVLLRLLARRDLDPRHLATAAAEAIVADPELAPALAALDETRDAETPVPPALLATLVAHPLLIALLSATPIPNPRLELALSALRRRLLLAAAAGGDEPPLALAVALARQAFLNEYVWLETDGETQALDQLAARLREASTPRPTDLMLWASYRPLASIPVAGIDRASLPAELASVFAQQIDEPAEERRLAATIPSDAPIADAVSIAVRAQYEENPYPRWDRMRLRTPQAFRTVIRERFPYLAADELPVTDDPRVLIAGCGTGLETMRVVTSYRTSRVLAVDLSRASIAYGMRKLAEYGIGGVEHRQADILSLGSLDERFDLIDSFGVIHHMADPAAGLAVLASVLAPGGYLFVGLYSRFARGPVRRARDLIRAEGITVDASGIRAFRRRLLVAPDPELALLASPASDFWTLSDCRDLMFHVEEHHFELPEIGALFAANGLEFLALETRPPDLAAFRRANPDERALRSLDAWHAFERDHPETFGHTYRIWARKPAG